MTIELINHIITGVDRLKINVKNITITDVYRLSQYVNLFYPNAESHNFVIYGYKADKIMTKSTYVGKLGYLDRYELFGCEIGGSISYSSATGVTTKYETIIYGLDGSETVK